MALIKRVVIKSARRLVYAINNGPICSFVIFLSFSIYFIFLFVYFFILFYFPFYFFIFSSLRRWYGSTTLLLGHDPIPECVQIRLYIGGKRANKRQKERERERKCMPIPDLIEASPTIHHPQLPHYSINFSLLFVFDEQSNDYL